MSMIIQSGRRPAVAGGGGLPYTTGLVLDLNAPNIGQSFGTTVNTWADDSGQNNDFSKDNGAPEYVNGTLGEAVRITNAGNDRFGPHDFADFDLTAMTIFLVVDLATVADAGYMIAHNDSGRNGWFVRTRTTDQFEMYIPSSSSDYFLRSGNVGIGAHLTEIVVEDGNQQMWVDGVSVDSQTNTLTLVYDADTRASIGGRSTAPGFWTGAAANVDFHRYLIYNSVLSTSNRESVRDYLNTEWSVY